MVKMTNGERASTAAGIGLMLTGCGGCVYTEVDSENALNRSLSSELLGVEVRDYVEMPVNMPEPDEVYLPEY